MHPSTMMVERRGTPQQLHDEDFGLEATIVSHGEPNARYVRVYTVGVILA